MKKTLFIITFISAFFVQVHAENSVQSQIKSTQDQAEPTACLPPNTDTNIPNLEDKKKGPITEQPQLGCAVILCLMSPTEPQECTKVLDTLYGRKWLGRHKPRWPKCKSDNVETKIESSNGSRIVRNGCVVAAFRKSVSFIDTTIHNHKKKLGTLLNVDDGKNLFFEATIPYRYNIRIRQPYKNYSCSLINGRISYSFTPKRHKPKTQATQIEHQEALNEMPVCPIEEPINECISPDNKQAIEENNLLPEAERLTICQPSCIDKTNKEAVAKNERLPKSEQITYCGECDVTEVF